MITSAVVKQLLSYVGIYIEYCPLDMVNVLGVQVSLLNWFGTTFTMVSQGANCNEIVVFIVNA